MLTQDLKERAAELQQRFRADPLVSSYIQEFLDFLPNCEYELIRFMVAKNVWQGFIPSPPANYKPNEGTVDLGLALYWLNNPSQINFSMFSAEEEAEAWLLILALDGLLQSSQMTQPNADFFKTNELIYTDGSVLSEEKWATFDQGWLVAVLNMLQSIRHNLWYHGEQLPDKAPTVIRLTGATPGLIKIAVLGDCGTGDYTLQRIMQSIVKENPDYIIHVGDVYYAGTPLSNSPNGNYFFFPGEEVGCLNNFWPPQYRGRSFTLNSNHEMYSGAIGYFNDALDAANGGARSLFSAQQGSSYFFLQCGDWTLACLDTAYQSSVTNAFMNGSIGLPSDVQTKAIQQLRLNPYRTILFTHHNGFEADCSDVSPLWDQVRTAFGSDPYAWYWGHVHNGIVYNKPIHIPIASPKLSTQTWARCLGHAALPYGDAANLINKQITWRSTNRKPNSKELYNGWAMLNFTLNNNTVTQIQESFYDLSQNAPVFRQIIFSR
ncbi:metallophosphoesterase family protein [Pseudoflavitalea rhizosphaerae]|uniref:metallophosphoesterase family protein n=1 Tax=Pseudoflavitalea rhizosphaerae TaxID=1884793 RepID=UPI000F8E843A|nr:metallophosphoesterase [Pseudoflavitalea rhizosphaerae]